MEAATDLHDLPPGPRLPKAAQAYLWNSRFERFSGTAHARYGQTLTLRFPGMPTAVLTTDRDAIRRLFTGDPLVKRHGNDAIRLFLGDNSLMELEPAPHLARRKLLLPPFHGERVQVYGRLMQRLVDEELDGWRAGEELSVLPRAQTLTLELILQAVFGISDSAMRRRLRGIYDKLLAPSNNIAIFVPALTRRARWNLASHRFWQLKDELDAIVLEQIAATRADPAPERRDDILALLVQARDQHGDGLDDEQLRDELLTLISAGHETTATAIAWGVLLLVANPDVLARARAAAAADDDAYWDAVCKEVLRIRPTVPVTSARHVLEPFEVSGWTIAPQNVILVNAHALHRDPAIYSEPEAFRPERFLEDPPDGYSFLPFGGGVHRCLGAALAMQELRIVLRAIVTRRELALPEPGLEQARRRGVTLVPCHHARVRVVAERAGRSPAAAPAEPMLA
jgi:cytochrome P450